MRTRRPPVRVALVAVLLVLLVAGAAACGGDDDRAAPAARGPNPTGHDPGPNPTTFDPGPNPTGGGPTTVDGTLRITAQCLTLQRPSGALDLRFDGYARKGTGLADDTGTVLAHDGDRIAVAGHRRRAKDACGTRFDVDNLVTVLPR